MIPLPLPSPVKFPDPVLGPTQPILLPSFQIPEWEPIPIYRELIPALNPGRSEPEAEEEEEKEDEQTNEDKEDTAAQQELAVPITLPAVPEMEMVNQITIPVINIDVPLPKAEIVTIAVTTAGVAAIASVGGTMIANNLFRQLIKIFKPLIKTVLKKVMKARGKEMKSWSRQRLEEKRLKLRSQ